jgi:hypothetical protein
MPPGSGAHGAHGLAEGAGQGPDPLKRMAVALRPAVSTVGCAICSKTGFARTQPWPARSVCSSRLLIAHDRFLGSPGLPRGQQSPQAGRSAAGPRSPNAHGGNWPAAQVYALLLIAEGQEDSDVSINWAG